MNHNNVNVTSIHVQQDSEGFTIEFIGTTIEEVEYSTGQPQGVRVPCSYMKSYKSKACSPMEITREVYKELVKTDIPVANTRMFHCLSKTAHMFINSQLN